MNRLTSLLVLALILPIVSCVMSKTYTDEEKKMRMEPDQYFVIKTNGEKVTGKKISLSGGLSFSGWVKLDGQKYQFDDLLNVQDRHAYYAKFNNLWVKQLKRGKINLYYFETSSPMMGSTPSAPTRYVYTQHFVFQKGDG